MEKLELRVKRLEDDMESVCEDLKLILTNHLPHIQTEVESLKTQMKIYGALILAGISALIVIGLTA